MEESLGAIKEAQQAGKIRHVGLSEVSVAEIERARKVLPIVSVQNRLDALLAFIAALTGEENALCRLLRHFAISHLRRNRAARTHEITAVEPFLPWFPVGGGRGVRASAALDAVAKAHNASVYQVALAWELQRSPVMLPIPGTQNVKHVEENCAAPKLKLTPEEWKSLAA